MMRESVIFERSKSMSNRNFLLSDAVHEYILSVTLREPDVLRRLRAETAAHPRANMQIAPEQGQLMQLLVFILQARKALEVGVFTGYSSLAVALALPPDGKLVACDVSEEYVGIARRYWREAGVAEKISLRLAPAVTTLDELLAQGEAETFDFAFIDADKENYDAYYERALKLVRKGGVIAFDNVLWSGRVLDPTASDPDTTALRNLNRKLHADERVAVAMLPVSDGLTLTVKR
jgi:caffeoyl-CoA O-methyltransferase